MITKSISKKLFIQKMESYLKSRKPIILVQSPKDNDNNTDTKTTSKWSSDDKATNVSTTPVIVGPLNTNVCNWDQILKKR